MIVISPINTRRISAQFKELPIGDAIYICNLPAERHELNTGELIKRVLEPSGVPRVGQVIDPQGWTVQERAYAVANYLAHVIDGEPDFKIGETGKLSDYLLSDENPPPPEQIIGVVGEDSWKMVPLIGAYSEAIEYLILTERLPKGAQGWYFGAMAAQMLRADEPDDVPPDYATAMPAVIYDWVEKRANFFRGMPESLFIELLHHFMVGQRKLDHTLSVMLTDEGVVFVSREVPVLPPARFHVSDAISERTQEYFGKVDEQSA